MFEAVLLAVPRAVYDDLGPDDQAEVDQLLGILEIDPHLDGVHKVRDSTQGIDIYENGAWVITYKIVDNAFVEVWGIWRALPPYTFKNEYPFPTF